MNINNNENQNKTSISGKKVFVAGHRGMVGSAIARKLALRGDCELITASRDQLDLRNQPAVFQWLENNKPDLIFLAAAKVGGILANKDFPAHFLYDNLSIQSNVVEGARRAGVEKLLFLGSSCIYPKFAPQPIDESSLLTGPLEPTNEWYAIAKIAGIKLCQSYRVQYGCNYISAMPTNLYGPNDNFDLSTSHVLPALIRKIHNAKEQNMSRVSIWGSGSPRREFMHVEDLAEACVFLMEQYNGYDHINIGFGSDVTIKDLASTISKVVGYTGQFEYDTTKPDGTPRKLMNNEKISQLGWHAKIELLDGISNTYKWYLENYENNN